MKKHVWLLVLTFVALSCGKNTENSDVSFQTIPLEVYAANPGAINPPTCQNGNMLVCHIPPGNPENKHEICIGQSAVPTHLTHHGDYLGVCNPNPNPNPSPTPSPSPSPSPTPEPTPSPSPTPEPTPSPTPWPY